MKHVDVDIAGDIAYIWLNRPEKRNAFNSEMISNIVKSLSELEFNKQVRFIVIKNKGSVFSAGADLQWMAESVNLSVDENREEALLLASLFESIHRSSKIIIAAVKGHCYGGAIGLVAACDFVIATPESNMSFREVRIGLVPATIAPFVAMRVGLAKLKLLMLTGEMLSAKCAKASGIVDEVVEAEQLMDYIAKLIRNLRFGGISAQYKIKELCNELLPVKYNQEIKNYTANLIAACRISDEGQEGVQAFLERRKPKWQK